VAYEKGFPSEIVIETYDVDGNLVPGMPIFMSAPSDGVGDPSIAMHPDGSYLVTYERLRDADGTTDVVGRIVSASGVVGNEILIFDSGDAASKPHAEVLSNGNYVIVFADADSAVAGADEDPEFRIIDEAGAFVAGGVIDAGPNTVIEEVHVAALKGGGFVAVWEEYPSDGNESGIRARIYKNDGTPKSDAFTVNSTTLDSQREPEIASLPDGGFVVIWDDNGRSQAYGQRFDKKGKKIGKEFVAGDLDSEQSPFVGTLGDGRFVAGFSDFLAEDLLATIFDPRDEVIKGTKAADVITSRIDGAEVIGKKGKDILLGQKGKDLLHGEAGGDILAGDRGKDKLWGEGGKDKFVFDTALGGRNVDRLMEFKHNMDKFWLDMDIFAAIGPKLSRKEFALGDKAGNGNHHIIVNADGKAFYDEDGKGGSKQVPFAKLGQKARVDHGDFKMIEDLAL
jgi:Ca2+-binding RTX toxin-like protein